MEEIIALFATLQMKLIVALVGVDVIAGIIGALIKKDFVFWKLANFMKTSVLGYVLGFAVFEVVGKALPQLDFIVPVVCVLVVIALIASVIGNLGRLGLPLPKILRK